MIQYNYYTSRYLEGLIDNPGLDPLGSGKTAKFPDLASLLLTLLLSRLEGVLINIYSLPIQEASQSLLSKLDGSFFQYS